MIEKFLNLISPPVYAGIKEEMESSKGYFTFIKPMDKGSVTLGELFTTIIDILLWVVGIIAVIYLIWAGISYITAGGDDAKATKARQSIINAVIGIVVVLLAFVIVGAVGRIFGSGAGGTT